jgi:hypothetical protein
MRRNTRGHSGRSFAASFRRRSGGLTGRLRAQTGLLSRPLGFLRYIPEGMRLLARDGRKRVINIICTNVHI